MKSAALESWKYRNPEDICDGLIAESKRRDESEKKRFEIQLKQNRRRIKAIVRHVKKNGGSR